MTSPRPETPYTPHAGAQRRLRVLHVIWWGEVGGIALNLVDLARHCQAHNQAMDVCVLTKSSPLIDSLADQNVRVRAMGARSGHDLRAFVRFFRFLRHEAFEIVHDHTGSYLAALAILLGATNARKIHQEHGAINVPRLKARKKLFYRLFGRLYDPFIAISAKTAEDMIHESVAPRRVETIANPVDPLKFSPQQPRQDAKLILGIPDARLTVGTACRFVKEKDLDLFLQVAHLIIRQRHEIAFVMVGAGEEWRTLHRRAAEHGILDAVRFTGMRNDMATVWRAFDVYLFTSRIEPFGRTLLESLACETPVVAAVPISGGGIDVVRETPGILSVADRDPERLATLTLQLLDSPALRSEKGRLGRQWVVERYHVTDWVKALDDVYRKPAPP